MTITKTFTAAATILSIALGTAASAQATNTVSIDTSGMNLGNPAMVSSLNARIERTARQVCAVGSSRDLKETTFARKCYANAVADAKSNLNRQVAAYAGRHGTATLAASNRIGK